MSSATGGPQYPQQPYGSGGYAGEQHGPYGGAPPVAPPPRNGFGITALVLAISGVLFGLIPLTGFLALLLGLLAVLFGLLGLGRVRRRQATNRGLTLAGTVLGAVAVALGVWGLVVVFGAVQQLGRDLEGVPPVVAPAQPGALPAAGEGDATAARYGDRVTVGDLTLVADPLQDAELPFGGGPAACSTVAYENTGGAPAPFNLFDWSIQSAEGAITSPTFTGDDDLLGSGELVPGGRTAGRVCFEGTADGSTLIYQGNPFDRQQVGFTG